jgi:hypothetical protein
MGLYYKICLMNQTMHIGDKWNILMLDLTYHFLFKALEGVDSINTKTHQSWGNFLLL